MRNQREFNTFRPTWWLCDICNRPITDKGLAGAYDKINLDHNHSTGRFRGWLCAGCNRAIGYFEKKQERILTYLGVK